MLHTILRKTECATLLAKSNGIEVAELERRVLAAMLKHQIILAANDPDDWNINLKGHCDFAQEPLALLEQEVFNRELNLDDLTLFAMLELIGDGECEFCGGDVEAIDGLYKDYGDDVESPVWERVRCTRCKNTMLVTY